MSLNEIKIGAYARYATRIMALLLAAVFLGGNVSHATPPQGQVYCASDDGKRHYCNLDTRGGVRMIKQHSGDSCIEGRTWGFDRNGVWVDRGCRADFESAGRYGGGREYGRPGPGPGPGRGGAYSQTFRCESGDMKRHYCAEGALGRGEVSLIKQHSDAACVFGRTWGRDRNGLWVDRGCRADFEVRR